MPLKTVLFVLGFDVGLRVAEDWDMWMRLSRFAAFAAVPRPLVTLLSRRGSLGGDPDRMFEGARLVIEKNAELFHDFWDWRLLRRRAEARLYERRGIGYLMRGDFPRARADLWQAVRLWPPRLHALVPLAKLLLGMVKHPPASGARSEAPETPDGNP